MRTYNLLKAQIRAYYCNRYGEITEDMGFCEFDMEQAIYWYAAFNHKGMDSVLYGVLSVSPYIPGPIETGVEPGLASDFYDFLVSLEAKNV